MATSKPTYETEKVTLDNGTVVEVKRVSMKNLSLFMELQERLLKKYFEHDGALINLIIDPEVISDLTAICNILPIVGKTEQYLNFEDIQENWEQLVTLFFNSGLDAKTRTVEKIAPGKIGNLHFFPYLKVLNEYQESQKEN